MGSKNHNVLHPFARFCLLVSSASPVLLGLAIGFCSQTNGESKKVYLGAVILVATLLVAALTVIVVHHSFGQLERTPVSVQSVEPLDGQGLTQLVALLIPLLVVDTSKITATSALVAFAVFALMAWRSSSHHVHPLLMVFGYKIYKIMTSSGVGYVMISRHEVRRADKIKLVGYFTDYLVVDLTGEPIPKN